MSYKRKEVIGECELYLGDCLDVMPMLGKVDAVVTDPPYGINLDTSIYTNKKGEKHGRFKPILNDNILLVEHLSYIFALDLPTIMFGSNNFPELLPHRGRTIVWDKRVTAAADGLRGSPFEIAWENRKTGYDRIVRVQHGGVINADSVSGNSAPRYHPTQKPVKMIKKCLNFKPYIDSETILDPFMGSGTTGVACVKLGRKFIGIELEEKYFDIACKRIEEAYKQPDLFLEADKAEQAMQEEMKL